MALSYIITANYNNYFNKLMKRPSSNYGYFSSYVSDGVLPIVQQGSTAFNENDGVTTTLVLNKDIDNVGDYLFVTTNGNTIVSRWFITEARRNRNGQCLLTLQRDLIVDYYDTIKSAPAFIERGMLSNDDPMIFNDEGLQYNQIKQSQTPLWDKTRCGWIIGYMAKGIDFSNHTESGSSDNYIEANVTASASTPAYTWASWNDAPALIKQLCIQGKTYNSDAQYITDLKDFGFVRVVSSDTGCYYVTKIEVTQNASSDMSWDGTYDGITTGANGSIIKSQSTGHSDYKDYTYHSLSNASFKQCMATIAKAIASGIVSGLDDLNQEYDINNSSVLSTIDSYDGVVVSVAGTTYVLKKYTSESTITVDFSNVSSVKTAILNAVYNDTTASGYEGTSIGEWKNSSKSIITSLSGMTLSATIKVKTYGLAPDELGQVAIVKIPKSDVRQQTVDAVYDMFAIPYPLNEFGYTGKRTVYGDRTATTSYQIDSETAMAIATAIARVATNASVYDVQLLPYCPIEKIYTLSNNFVMPPEGNDCQWVRVNGVVTSFVYFCHHSQFSKTIEASFLLNKSADSKSQKTLYKYRVTSGNYASMFDFTPDMNNGIDYTWHIYCNYKPYKPFIKLNPTLDYMYGQESFRDTTGLILGGDFSITTDSSKWQEYIVQNKNYEAMFDRSIQTLEYSNSVNATNMLFSTLAGTGIGATAGGVAGFKAGGAIGAVAGAAVGGIASGIAGAVDYNNQVGLMNDNVNLQKEMHSYQLDNIKALPNTIQKVSAYTIVDKVVPVFEVFKCTPTEELAFANYIKYNGMTVGRIGTIAEFASNGGFIQGRFIRLEGLSEDYHLAKALDTTFQAGFYFDGGED